MVKEITDSASMETDEILFKLRRTIDANRKNLGALDISLAYGMCHVPSDLPRDSAVSMLRLIEELLLRNAGPEEFVEATIQGETDDVQSALHYADAKQEIDENWRKTFQRQSSLTTPPGITNTQGWSDDEIKSKLTSVKNKLDWENTTGSAKKWWEAFENENDHRLALVLRLAEELANRKATITEFFLSYVYSNTDNIQANLFYLDYTRLKKEEERKKKEAAARAKVEAAQIADESLSEDFDEDSELSEVEEFGDEIWEENEQDEENYDEESEFEERGEVQTGNDSTELTFVRCPNCRSLVPAVSTRCRMCGAPLDLGDETSDEEAVNGESSNIEPEIEDEQIVKKNVFDNRFEVLSVIGRGVGSIVYHARYVDGEQEEVALKVLLDRLDQVEGALPSDLLRKEALAMVSSRHKHVIRLDDFHSLGVTCYLTMEYAELSDLRKYARLKKNGKLSWVQSELFLLQAAEALDFIHKAGILHRDIKPNNILVADDQNIRIGDFGNAILPGERSFLRDLEGNISGIEYLPPEILSGEAFDRTADLYSLGVTFYELLSGVNPFLCATRNIEENLKVRHPEEFELISMLEPEAPAHLLYAIEKLMEFDPRDRFQTAKELIESLVSFTKSSVDEKMESNSIEEQRLDAGEITVNNNDFENEQVLGVANDANFDQQVLKSKIPVLVDFWAPWCGPCKSIRPALEELALKFADSIRVVTMNVDENPSVPTKYSVRGIPNLVIFRDGEVVDQIVGAVPTDQIEEAILKILSQNGN